MSRWPNYPPLLPATACCQVSREAGPVKGGNTVIAFVEDPTGYKWELIQREKPSSEPLCQVSTQAEGLPPQGETQGSGSGCTPPPSRLLRCRQGP